MNKYFRPNLACAAAFAAAVSTAQAHDPVFGLGPHTLLKHRLEVHLGAERKPPSPTPITAIELAYGMTSRWSVRARLPYVPKNPSNNTEMSLASKYRFWRHDSPGQKHSASVFVDLQSGQARAARSGYTTNTTFGISYGYQDRRQHRWAALRYLNNGEDDIGQNLGDKLFIDLAAGVRFQTGQEEPSWIWMLEFNGEHTRQADNQAGQLWFLSPGLMWSRHNLSLKTGVQLPAYTILGSQHGYRARLELEWHS